jgi:hypothetical protein
VKAWFSDKMLTAYESFLESQACLGKRDPMLEKQWGKFCKVMKRVGKAIKSTDAPAAHIPRQPALATFQRQTIEHTPSTLKAVSDLCWEYSRLGECKFGSECKHKHLGAPGALKHTIVDVDGNCLQYIKYGDCRRLARGNCPLKHGEQPEDVEQLTADQHEQFMKYCTDKQLDPVKYTYAEFVAAGGNKTSLKAIEDTPRRIFTVLHADKAPKSRKRAVTLHSAEDY